MALEMLIEQFSLQVDEDIDGQPKIWLDAKLRPTTPIGTRLSLIDLEVVKSALAAALKHAVVTDEARRAMSQQAAQAQQKSEVQNG